MKCTSKIEKYNETEIITWSRNYFSLLHAFGFKHKIHPGNYEKFIIFKDKEKAKLIYKDKIMDFLISKNYNIKLGNIFHKERNLF